MSYGKSKPKSRKNYRTKKSKATNSRSGKSTFITSKCREIGKQSKRVQRSIDIFPSTWFAKFKFSESSFINPLATGALSAIGYQYSLNNTFDPRFSLGGAQPLWYDQVMPYYERLWDHCVKVELVFSNPTEDGMYCGYRVRTTTDSNVTVGKDFNYLQQMPLTEMKPINNTGQQIAKFTFFVKNHKVLGITKDQYHNLEYSHTNSASPSVNVLLEPFAFSTVSDSTAIRYDLKITYFSELTNRITPAQSA